VAVARSPRVLIATVVLGTLLNPLDGSMMAVALPAIREHFAASAAVTSWLITVYYIGGAVAQPIMGRIADQFGARRVFIGGLLLVVITCTAAQFAPSVDWLIALRLLQAVGSSVAFPAGLIVVRRHLAGQPERSSRAVGSITWINSLAGVAGPLVGGAIVQLVDWRGPFLFGIPFALLGAITAFLVLPKDAVRGHHREGASLWTRIDALGALLLGTVIASTQLAIVSMGGAALAVWGAAALVALVLLVWRMRRARHPFLNPRVLFADAKTPAVLVQYAIANFTFFAVIISFPSWLQLAHGLSPLQSGSITFPIAVAGVTATVLLSRHVYRGHGQRVLLGTAFVTLCGAVLLGAVDLSTPLVVIALLAVASAAPNNLTTVTLQSSLYQRVNPEATGAATGLFQTFRYCGATLASTVVGINLGGRDPGELTDGMHTIVLCALVASALALLLALVFQPGAAPDGRLSAATEG
jgi:MFS family permease